MRGQGLVTGRLPLWIAAFAAALLAMPAMALSGSGTTITAVDDDYVGGAGAGADEYAIETGSEPLLRNDGNASHNVTALDDGPDRDALFRTGNVRGGDAEQVAGTQYLDAGEYAFMCTIHPEMRGTLAVSGTTPLARPEIALSVSRQPLAKVVKKGKLKVEVEAATDSPDVALSAKAGSTRLGKSKLDLAAGETRNEILKLSKKAKKALEDSSKAKVKLTGSVPFGASASAKRTLR